MKVSNYILSFIGFCIFYICNANWIDDLYDKIIEDYFGSEYEEVPPFISSVTAGTEEFDRLVEELAKSKRKWFTPILAQLGLVSLIMLPVIIYRRTFLCQGREIFQTGVKIAGNVYRSYFSSRNTKAEIQNIVTEILETKLKNKCKDGDDIPVELLWKGGTLVESTINCNIREDPKFHDPQKLQQHMSKLMLQLTDTGGGDKSVNIKQSEGEYSMAQKMAEIRRLLESEQEIQNKMIKGEGMEDGERNKTRQIERKAIGIREEMKSASQGKDRIEELEEKDESDEYEDTLRSESNPQLMNRIRLLESRLRLEELKNKNWISRMSRAEGILQQLNKQVERIEETRPLETLTETLKITSTVTNWSPSSHPKRNMQFTLVNQFPPYYLQTPYMSLSDVIKREVGLPCCGDFCKTLFPRNLSPKVPMLPTTKMIPQSLFSKFLSK